ncbi:MAG TPA: 1-(5-phosphoribosyl)-5-[(5-phosphoribosylamino)methylideneamino]imidazole-4-carboxamide isomerase [Clostridia bacterium]|nr:1-(5-phosphoribosyl)-5-[(5-phosphoribosylamino)methylideneamino]imidazole-4-carboxamide isomerase [Clostridia bacterium]
MELIPAIDLRLGRCVRLVRGRVENETIYSENPLEMAQYWEEQGAERLHVVDLDGAFTGSPQNMGVIKEIAGSVKIPVQVGGGIRETDTIEELLDAGVNRVILGTVAILKPEFVGEVCEQFGEAIVVGIDAKKGKVAIEGWGVTSEKDAVVLAREMGELGIKRVIFTDVNRDGTLEGPNIGATAELARKTGLKVVASGGVSTIDDLKAIKPLEEVGVEGIIVGKALYAETLSISEALALMSNNGVR